MAKTESVRRYKAVDGVRVEEVEGVSDQMRIEGFDTIMQMEVTKINGFQNGTRLLILYCGRFDLPIEA